MWRRDSLLGIRSFMRLKKEWIGGRLQFISRRYGGILAGIIRDGGLLRKGVRSGWGCMRNSGNFLLNLVMDMNRRLWLLRRLRGIEFSYVLFVLIRCRQL